MKKSNSKNIAILALIGAMGLFTVAPIYADTMVVIDEDTSVDDVANVLELPENVSPEAATNSTRGLDTANAAREGGREFGEQQAASARSRGQDARENAGAGARDNAGSARDAGGNRGAGGAR